MSAVTNITPLIPQTLDGMWREAEQLGRVSVDHRIFGDAYEVSISFERKSGTRIRAMGKDTNILFALANAINEAREMGA